FYEILEDENLNEKAKEKLEKEFSTELHIIKRDDRLETIAKDIISHFPRRGYLGKGMVICVDKFTAVKMYDKVEAQRKLELKKIVGEISKTSSEVQKSRLTKKRDFLRSLEMAVVISEDAGEDEKFTNQGLDIKPHRKKLNTADANGHDIEYRFKDPEDKLQLVFVCAMWLTGFDAPTVSTLYLDKPMKDHTLMQTIARANRVSSFTINGVSKTNGEIVDYYNVFRNMKKALSDYALGDEDGGETPVHDKSELFELLDEAITLTKNYCEKLSINLEKPLQKKETFRKINLFKSWADTLLSKDEYWKEYKVYENTVSSLYEACKPEILEGQFRPLVPVVQYLRGIIDGIIKQEPIDEKRLKIEELLDESIVTSSGALFLEEGEPKYGSLKKGNLLDLSKINFGKLKEDFKQKTFKHIEITNLREFLKQKLEIMLTENSTRTDFADKLQDIINTYNSGGMSTENYFEDLVKFAEEMKTEDERWVREGLSKDELEIFDVLKKEKLTKDEEIKVKNAAKHLLKRLVEEQPKVLIQDWFKDSQSQIKVKSAIEEVLDADLPKTYNKSVFQEKSKKLYELVYEYASRGLKWAS
ncbi:MAG TPA: type I restriction enzyme endonuclease domain-containing protein, partial [Treponemataceae bacterium]|nr:type I restriction enzyme endonuclease domain-containing protein [Treponemataceae bacterium]